MCGTKVLKQKSPRIEETVLMTSGRFFFLGLWGAFGDHDYTWGQERWRYLATGLLNHVGDVNLGIHDFTEFSPTVLL